MALLLQHTQTEANKLHFPVYPSPEPPNNILAWPTSHSKDTPYLEILQDLPPILWSAVCAQAQLGWDQLYHGQVINYLANAFKHLHPELAMSGCQILTIDLFDPNHLAIHSGCMETMQSTSPH